MIFQRHRNCCNSYSVHYSLGHSWVLCKLRWNSLPEVTANSLLFSESQIFLRYNLCLYQNETKWCRFLLSWVITHKFSSLWLYPKWAYILIRFSLFLCCDARCQIQSGNCMEQNVFGFLFFWMFNPYLVKVLSRYNLGTWTIWQRFPHIFIATKEAPYV